MWGGNKRNPSLPALHQECVPPDFGFPVGFESGVVGGRKKQNDQRKCFTGFTCCTNKTSQVRAGDWTRLDATVAPVSRRARPALERARGNGVEALLAPKLINPGIFIALEQWFFCNGAGFPFSDTVDTSTIAGLYKYPATENDFAFPLGAVCAVGLGGEHTI